MTKIIFLHIPKTAGTTFRKQILNKLFDKKHSFHIDMKNNSTYDFLAIKRYDIEMYKLITGHVSFGIHKNFNEDFRYIAFLREPVQRIISHYFFTKNNNLINEEIIKKNLSLKEYALSNLSVEMDNAQTRQISGTDVPINKIDDKILDIAKQNINNYFEIGITERFDESLILLKETFKWRLPLIYYRENVSKGKQKVEIDEETIEAIKQRNKYDIELYNWCLLLFNKRLNHIFNIEKKIEFIKKINTYYSFFWGRPILFIHRSIKNIKRSIKSIL